MEKFVFGIIFYLFIIHSIESQVITSDTKEFDFIKKFELNNPQKDSDGNLYYTLNHTISKKFKLSEILNSKKPESIVIDIIFRLDVPNNVTFDLFEIHDNTKSEPLKGSVFFSDNYYDSELEPDNDSYNLSDYESNDDWYRLTFVYNFDQSKLSIYYNCDADNAYEENIERKSFFENHHKIHFHHLLHVTIGGLSDSIENVKFEYDIMKLTSYSGSDFSNLGFCEGIF